MRFHLPALPGRPVTPENSHCAYTGKLVKFRKMMRARGHEVIIYGAEGAEADVECYPEGEDLPPWEAQAWAPYNGMLIAAMNGKVQEGDFICLMNGAGRLNQPLAAAFPGAMAVETGIGYEGTFSEYRVFESAAWMHMILGHTSAHPMSEYGHNFDVVIHNFFDPEEFPFEADKDDYYLFIGRMIESKGIRIAEEVCKRLDAPLILAGGEQEYEPEYGEYIGPVGPEQRGELMGKARAVFAPTLYVEPGGGAMMEPQFCGTPVLTSPWGAPSETVENGVTGFQARSLGQFLWAAEHVDELKPRTIRRRALARFSLKATAVKYERYFDYLERLWHGEGWYDEERVQPW